MRKKHLFIGLLLALAAFAVGLLKNQPPVLNSISRLPNFGEVAIAKPLWGSQGFVVVFADTQKYPAAALGQRLARIGMTVAVVDTQAYFKRFSTATGVCLDATQVATAIAGLAEQLRLSANTPTVVAGISNGALLPFLNAQANAVRAATNLAVDFSVNVPDGLLLCAPLTAQDPNQKTLLLPQPNFSGHWRAVWTDQPPEATAVFIKTLGNVETQIAAYDTPLDGVLADELNNWQGHSTLASPPMPMVDVPAAQARETLTIFYSGDGGWRDLDRTIAGEMAALNYPVAGVDVLRYFWERKTPEQAAADLSATMAYYRKNRHVKAFVLAGYSFGADILPAVYQRLPQADKDSVSLLVLLALAKNADFEIHVSGWLGQNAGELPQAPELAQIPKTKILCIYGKEEIAETACTDLQQTAADILELPGGHHFDQDYPKLTQQILNVYRQHGID
ncbi:hypothetical protein JCM14076_08620 [Methylosoma difficile]